MIMPKEKRRLGVLGVFAVAVCAAGLLMSWSNIANAKRPKSHHDHGCDASHKAAFNELFEAMERIERVNRSNRPGHVKRHRIDKIISRATRHADARLRVQPPIYFQPVVPTMEPDNFARLVQVVDDAFPDQKKMATIDMGTRDVVLTVDQVVGLLETVAFENNKIKVAKQLRPKIVDPQHWYQVCSAFSFNGSCEQVARQTPNSGSSL